MLEVGMLKLEDKTARTCLSSYLYSLKNEYFYY